MAGRRSCLSQTDDPNFSIVGLFPPSELLALYFLPLAAEVVSENPTEFLLELFNFDIDSVTYTVM